MTVCSEGKHGSSRLSRREVVMINVAAILSSSLLGSLSWTRLEKCSAWPRCRSHQHSHRAQHFNTGCAESQILLVVPRPQRGIWWSQVECDPWPPTVTNLPLNKWEEEQFSKLGWKKASREILWVYRGFLLISTNLVMKDDKKSASFSWDRWISQALQG